MRTKSILVLVVVVVLLTLIPTLFAAEPIDFDNMQIATTTWGQVAYECCPYVLAGYNNEVYFIVSDDGSANPSKLLRYNPLNGLSNTMNHSIITETTGRFIALREMDSSLYLSDNLGNLFSYDGSNVNTMTGTPFSASNFVYTMINFNGKQYYGTSAGDVYRYDGTSYEHLYTSINGRCVSDMTPWAKDGYIYASMLSPDNSANGYVVRSPTGDPGSWETIPDLANLFNTDILLPTENCIYASVTDSAYGFWSSIRKSSDGMNFDVISQSSGQYKWSWDTLYHDEIAYFFVIGPVAGGGFGYRIIDENGSVSLVANQNWALQHAIELNGEIYALVSSATYDPHYGAVPSDVYLITTVPEPATLLLLGLGGLVLRRKHSK
jgi:hypothetical protein